MTDKILRIPVTDLKTVRVLCKADGCSTAIEMPVGSLQKASLLCPNCGASMRRADLDKALFHLAGSIAFLQQADDGTPFELQFVLPADEGGS